MQYHAAAFYTACAGGIWRTRDGGAHWEKFSQKTQPADVGYRALDFSSRPGEAIAWGSGARVTNDDGKNWIDVAGPFDMYTGAVVPGSRRAIALPAAGVNDAQLANDGSVWLATGQGVWRREGDGPWSRSMLGLRAQGASVALWTGTDAASLLAYTFDTGWNRSDDDGNTWTAVALPGSPIRIPGSNELWFVGPSAGRTALYRSRDAGSTFELVNPAIATAKGDVSDAIPAGPDARVWYGRFLRYTSPGFEAYGLAVSRDGGRSWSDMTSLAVSPSSKIIPSPVSPSLAFASNSAGWHRTRDAGETWSLVSPVSQGFASVLPDAVDASTVYGYSEAALWVSRDAGSSWSRATLPDAHFLFTVTADPWDAGRLYAQATDGAILQSRDRGGRWERLVLRGPAPF